MFELSAGQIVADKYRIDGVMGTGGMGVVVAATHVDLDQRVAIKFLREVSPEALARFQREARLLVRLKNPHVARVIDVGSLDDDTPYIVMEHLDGEDLSFVVAKNKKLPVEETVDYILQASEAVAEAHALGMVHRDLKPANLFLARGAGGTTSVKVLDFGVSKILDDRSNGANDGSRGDDLTNEGVALGSPGYMSPEQMTSARDVDERSDIFSLGALLYRLVTGQTAFKGNSPVSILASMAIDGLTPVRSIAPEVPETFAKIVERCLAQDKAARYPTVAHLAHALAPYATRRGRVSIEQIVATLNVSFDDEQLGETVIQTVVAPNPVKAASRRAFAEQQVRGSAPSMVAPVAGAVAGAVGQTGPHPYLMTPGSTPIASLPPGFVGGPTTKKPLSTALVLGIVLAFLGVFLMAAALIRSRRGPARVSEEGGAALVEPPTASSPAVLAVPPVAPSPPATLIPATPITPEATTGSAGSAETRPRPPQPQPQPSPPPPVRPHGRPTTPTSPAHTGPSSAPPNPADFPGGRR